MTILVHDMTPLEHITSIHWPCCCIVNTCGVIHFYENLWFYLVKSNLCRFIYCLFISVVLLDPITREREREDWTSIKQYNLATFVCLSQGRDWIYNVICRVFSNRLSWEGGIRFVDIDAIKCRLRLFKLFFNNQINTSILSL
jgi:hypothetical protein